MGRCMYEWINKDDRDIGGFQELKLQPSLNMPIRPGIIRSRMRLSLLTKTLTGTLIRASDISRKKKAKFRGIFRGKFAEKSADFAGFSWEKSQNSRNNRPISGDFRGRKVKIRRKISPFRGIVAEKSQFSKDS